MADVKKPDRGKIEVDTDECKGCGLCIEACPPKVISLSERLNHYGYRTAVYAGAGCTGCGICFMACPEPGAITVWRLANANAIKTSGAHPFRDVTAEKDGATAPQTNSAEGATACASN